MSRSYRVRVGSPRLGALTRPNVLWIVTDDQETGTTGADVMPYLASKPHGSWVRFTNAMEAVPLCGPSRASLYKGQHWQQHGVIDHDNMTALDESTTVATALANTGYRTGLFGKYENHWPTYTAQPSGYVPPGWEAFWGRTSDITDYFRWTSHTNIPGAQTTGDGTDASYETDVMAGLADDFIRAADSRPWMCLLTPGSPHQDEKWPARHSSLTWTLTDPPDFNIVSAEHPAHLRSLPVLNTEATICRTSRIEGRRALRSVDEMLQTLVTALSDTGQLENTVIVYMTDNASMMGRKRRWNGVGTGGEKLTPYHSASDSLLHIRYPGAPQRDEPAPVTTIDLPCSFVKWAGGTWGHTVAGSTRLADWCLGLGGTRPAAEFTYGGSYGVPAWKAIVTADNLKYVEYASTAEREVYDLTADPAEMANLYGDDPTRDADLAAQLSQHFTTPLFWGS